MTTMRLAAVAVAACLLSVGSSRADKPADGTSTTVVLADKLGGSTTGKQTGGKFVPGGWTPVGPDDRILWEFPRPVKEGCVEVSVTNFDPAKQAVGNKNNFLGLWETLWECGGKKDIPEADCLYWRIGKNYPEFKIKIHTHGFSRYEKGLAPLAGGFDPKKTYRLKTEWRGGNVRLSLDGQEFLAWDCTDPDKFDRIRYVHLGSDPQFKSVTPGPVFSALKVVAYDAD